jgi:hypothetical protein
MYLFSIIAFEKLSESIPYILITQHPLKQTLVNHHLAGPILSVDKSMGKPFAHVSPVLLALHQHVVPNVSQILTALKMRVVIIKNVVTHVQEHVELMQNVKL